jgi:GNAT superfamily N-acetyltransferase
MGEITQLPIGAKERDFIAPVPLNANHDVSHFDCGKEPLNSWLRTRAARNEGRASRTFVVCHRTGPVAGFYSLNTGSVQQADAPKELARNMPDPIPTLLIGRLAVDKQYQGQGLGEDLLRDALARALTVSQEAGMRAVLVHAIDQDIIPFYAGYGFKAFPGGSLTLFLPVEHIAAAI